MGAGGVGAAVGSAAPLGAVSSVITPSLVVGTIMHCGVRAVWEDVAVTIPTTGTPLWE
jgi:hypothetical protein